MKNCIRQKSDLEFQVNHDNEKSNVQYNLLNMNLLIIKYSHGGKINQSTKYDIGGFKTYQLNTLENIK